MALPATQQAKYWGITSVVFLGVLWILGDAILPYVLGGAIAYFLDPVADRLENMGLSRAMATTVISLVMVLAFVVAVLLIVPTLIEQAVALVNVAPEAFRDLQTYLTTKFPQISQPGSTINSSIMKIGEMISSKGGAFVESVLSSALGVVNVLMLLVITPVVAFYLLLDWDRLVGHINNLLPRDHAPSIRAIAKEVDKTLASFIRGQGTVCLILGTYYAVALMLVGLQFGLVIGFIAGLVTFIPYVGAIIGGALAIGLALFQFWGDWMSIGLVAGVFVVGQMLEGNILTPKLVGSSVGLHPVWLIFALSAFGLLFGFVGMLVAVPVAASLGVVARFFTTQYKSSRLYLGYSRQQEDDA
ncbi:MAG: AI-2E family transporter [Halocynthiibacter sp.]